MTIDKVACVSGSSGQDGSYLCEYLLDRNYEVHALVRPSTRSNYYNNLTKCIDHPHFHLHHGDLCDYDTLRALVDLKPDELYHLGAATQVARSFECPTYYMDVIARATASLLQLLRDVSPSTRMYFAGTSEMMAYNPHWKAQDETFPLHANSPYGAAKIAAHLMCEQYRQAYGLFVVNGIAHNHESARRPKQFVTRKLGLGVRAYLRNKTPVTLATVQTHKDWHHAKDTVRGMHLSLQHDVPGTYVFASGVARSVRDFAVAVCKHFGVSYRDAIVLDDTDRRPLDVPYLCGNARKAYQVLRWQPEITWNELVEDVCRE